jgi:pyruvate formate-lyase/glycerol dehydratase family glycyl radical enzyme
VGKEGVMLVAGVDEAVLRERIDRLELSGKIRRWKEECLKYEPRISTDRIRLIMESWKETEGENVNIRPAKALKRVCEQIPIAIHDWQMLVGSDTPYLIGGAPHIDLCADYLPALLQDSEVALSTPMFKGRVSKEDRDVLRECARYFSGKTIGERIRKTYEATAGTWYDDYVEAKGTIYYAKLGSHTGGPIMYERILAKGLRGIIKEAEERIQSFKDTQDGDAEKLQFWQAAIVCCEAVITLARRYSELVRRLSQKEPNVERRRELEEISQVCAWVPENPARTFHEALQCAIFIRQGVRLETTYAAISPGRLDQYLLPYFEKGIRDGSLTLERAAELIGNEIAFVNNQVNVAESSHRDMMQVSRSTTNLTLGGVKPDGKDASNVMTYLILHVAGLMRVAEPHISLRWHPGTPRWAMLKAIETNLKIGGGIPQFQNELNMVKFWRNLGYPAELAQDLVGEGCERIMARTGAFSRMNGAGPSNMALALDVALHDGVAPRSGKRIGVEIGDPRRFKTFEDVLTAFKKQYEFMVKQMLWLASLAYAEEERYHRQPFFSSVRLGCLERGKDTLCWREPQISGTIDRGIVDTADSLMAIKKLVFDDKRLTMAELLEAMDSNFKGERGEETRQMCLAAPKFGNDIDEVDFMARDLYHFSEGLISSQKPTPQGIKYVVFRPGVSWHYYGGMGVAALPNGRKSGEPLCDGSISPMQGQDKRGPTAVLRSVIKAESNNCQGPVLTLRFPATLMQSQENREKLSDMTETFLRNGGCYVQYNLVDAETLRDAQRHPEKYQDLVVRVGGYSTYFVQLVKAIQDEIIARTEHEL